MSRGFSLEFESPLFHVIEITGLGGRVFYVIGSTNWA